ncbi:MAG: hypothetical protein ACRDPR_18165, partial [Nocardioidaceae bacterium]
SVGSGRDHRLSAPAHPVDRRDTGGDLLPLIEGLGVSTRDEIGIDTSVHRLGTEAVAHHAVGSAAPVVGAWSTVLAG